MPKPSKGGGKKEKPKPPKVQIKELTDENEKLKQDLELLTQEVEQLRDTLTVCNTKMLTGLDKKVLQKLFNITEATNPMLIPKDTLLAILSKLIVNKQKQEVSVEARCEELEERVTEMNFTLTKNVKKTLAYELGLQDICQCKSLEEVRDKVYHLQYLAGEAYHEVSTVDPVHIKDKFPTIDGINSENDKPTPEVIRSLNNAEKLNLVAPDTKFPGETKVEDMHAELRMYIIKDLSYLTESGADWRMYAERVGIPNDTIEEWHSQNLSYTMKNVLTEWCKIDPCATVRLLHRHLKSPQMRCTLLAKRVADFYDVE